MACVFAFLVLLVMASLISFRLTAIDTGVSDYNVLAGQIVNDISFLMRPRSGVDFKTSTDKIVYKKNANSNASREQRVTTTSQLLKDSRAFLHSTIVKQKVVRKDDQTLKVNMVSNRRNTGTLDEVVFESRGQYHDSKAVQKVEWVGRKDVVRLENVEKEAAKNSKQGVHVGTWDRFKQGHLRERHEVQPQAGFSIYGHTENSDSEQIAVRLRHGLANKTRVDTSEKDAEWKIHRDMQIAQFLRKEERSGNRAETENRQGEKRHVFFLKVHKAASTTVMNVLYRFALSRHLNVMLPKHSNIISENNIRWLRQVMPFPYGASHFDVLCNHLVFNEREIRVGLPPDTKFIAIVREPFSQFVSAFLYYRTKFNIHYLKRIPGPDSVATYLKSPERYEPRLGPRSSYTHNRMSFDFGMDPRMMEDGLHISKYIGYLNRTFHLVMLSERFDESMVLLKRLLGWRLQDVLYVKNNVFANKSHTEYTSEQKQTHREFNSADYALYEHFSQLFGRKVAAEGRLFSEEVAAFVSLRERVEDFCMGTSVEWKNLTLAATPWSDAFSVSTMDCVFMTLPENDFVSVVRRWQYGSQFLERQRRMSLHRNGHSRRPRRFHPFHPRI